MQNRLGWPRGKQNTTQQGRVGESKSRKLKGAPTVTICTTVKRVLLRLPDTVLRVRDPMASDGIRCITLKRGHMKSSPSFGNYSTSAIIHINRDVTESRIIHQGYPDTLALIRRLHYFLGTSNSKLSDTQNSCRKALRHRFHRLRHRFLR